MPHGSKNAVAKRKAKREQKATIKCAKGCGATVPNPGQICGACRAQGKR
ncbi:MAG TPA: hypothetical protein PLD20_00850 [Blastocatellia bacterium]|nr:hypothetical protein [Blastocatellia bacterium]HMV81795.1 hypothetical protein [Blastocatellia bacterium]HMY70694.1 hypothetical protein [Blastocatellia bacterium]HMZ16483.1 hypothetical protein [Blastocatellia bacterium]HNG29468.1 hypothetical protein [Blastocatellia bacterium]